MDNHTCIQKDNITNIKEEQKRLRADLKYEARKHEDLQKTIKVQHGKTTINLA